jgi:polyisoprenyl-teichoic acid--peptidoglycan teichoic acid transferase
MSVNLGVDAFLQRARTALVVVVAVSLVAIGGAYVVAARKIAQIPKVKLDTSVLEPGGNYLLVGSDSRAFVSDAADAEHFGSAQAQSGQRSDTIMVAHVDGGRGSGFIVSFPRDLWVDIPGIGQAKLNAAFNAGPQRLIETIEENFDVPISHYLQVDFAGFRDMVDAIGTIPISFPSPARDAKTGLSIAAAGCRRLTGDQALAYVRSRDYEQLKDGQWQRDPNADLGRIKRQQYFLRTLAAEAVHAAQRRPWRALGILDSALGSLQRDAKLGLSAFRALAYAFHGRGGNIESLTLPTRPQNVEGQAALVLDDAKAAPLLTRLRSESKKKAAPAPPTGVAVQDVQVTVQNGSGRTGAASTALDALRRAGFAVQPPATNADRNDYDVTEVQYVAGESGAKDKARLVLAYLAGAGKAVAVDSIATGADIAVVVGRDFTEVTPPAPRTRPSGAPPAGPTSHAAPSAPTGTGSRLPVVGCGAL